MFFTYILKSKKDQTHYYGHSKNMEDRLNVHNQGKVRLTKKRRPWAILYFEQLESKSEAYKREMFFKSIDGHLFLKAEKII